MSQAPLLAKPVLRRSHVERLLSCPTYEREMSEELAFGQAFASYVAAYVNLCRSAQEGSRLTDVVRLATAAWLRTPGRDLAREPEFMQLCERWATWHYIDYEHLLAVETTLTHDLGWAVVTGTMDRAFRADDGDPDDPITRLRIEDDKTERAPMEHGFQVRFYTQLAFLQPEYRTVQEVDFVVDPTRRQPLPAVTFARGELDFWWQQTTRSLRLAYAARRAGTAQPTGGPACQGCGLRRTCAEAIEPFRLTPETEEAAHQQFDEVLRLVQAVDVRKQGLKAYFANHPAQEIAGHEVGWLTAREPSFRVVGEWTAVKAALDAQGLDGGAVLKVDAAQLGNPALQDLLIAQGLGERAFSEPEFKWRKAAPRSPK